jgi:hypothetical protein
MCLLCWCLEPILYVDLPSYNTLCCAHCFIIHMGPFRKAFILKLYIMVGSVYLYFTFLYATVDKIMRWRYHLPRANKRKLCKLCCESSGGSWEVSVGLRYLNYNVFLQDSFESVPGLLWSTPEWVWLWILIFCFLHYFFMKDLINKCFGIHGKCVCVCVCERERERV